MYPILVQSFGYGHDQAPQADVTIDARRLFRNPHHDPAMRDLTGLDRTVSEHVMTTPGVRPAVRRTAELALDLAWIAGDKRVTVAVGCVGGRHRSVAMAEEVAELLNSYGVAVAVSHRDVAKPVIQK